MATTNPRSHLEATKRRHPTARTRPPGPAGRRSTPFLGLLAVITMLTLLGLVMVLSASSVSDLHEQGSSWFSFKRQLMWVLLGAGGLVFAMRLDYHHWKNEKLATLLLVVSVGLLVLVLVPDVGTDVNGSSRWLGAGPFRVQPSEFAKLAVLIFCAGLLARREERNARAVSVTLKPVLIVYGLVAVLILAQPNLGTTLVLGAIVMVLLFVSGTRVTHLAGLSLAGALGALVLTFTAGYRRARFTAFLDPMADPSNTGYQTVQSLVGIASGGLFGVGLGASRAKWGFLPYASTDFIFAIIAEELGLLGATVVLLLFTALAILGIRVSAGAPDPFGRLLAAGITAWFCVQAFVNIGAVVAVMPITGVPLPFVSFGGSSLVVSMVAAGILLNIARRAE